MQEGVKDAQFNTVSPHKLIYALFLKLNKYLFESKKKQLTSEAKLL